MKFAKRGKTTKVGCKVTARGAGSRIVCHLNRRSGRNWLMQLRDRRGALSTARGNGKKTMVFFSARKPRGTMRAFSSRACAPASPLRQNRAIRLGGERLGAVGRRRLLVTTVSPTAIAARTSTPPITNARW